MTAPLLLFGLMLAGLGTIARRRPDLVVGRGTAPIPTVRAARATGLALLLVGGALIAIAILVQFVTE